MKRLIALMMCAVSLGAAAQIEYPFPYNPDSDNSGWIGLSDLLSLLAVYNTDFEPSSWQTDSLSAHVDLGETMTYLECINACNKLPGAWRLVSLDEFGRALDIASPTPNDYWISSNISLRNEKLMVADASGVIEFNNLSGTANNRGCMCYIRANTFSQPSVSMNTSLTDVLSDLDSIFQQVEALENSLVIFGEQLDVLDSIGSVATSDTSINASLGSAILSCVDYGLHPQCSPQGGFCDNVSNDPTSDGRHTVTSSCQTTYDPDQCVSPNWRKFRIEAAGIGQANNLNILRVCDGYTGYGGNTYPSKFCQSSIPFDVVSDDVIEFFAGHDLGSSGLTGLSVSSGTGTSWSEVHHPMSVVIEGRHYFLPFGLRF